MGRGAGEEWSVTIRLKNVGGASATAAVASLAVNVGSVVPATVTGEPRFLRDDRGKWRGVDRNLPVLDRRERALRERT